MTPKWDDDWKNLAVWSLAIFGAIFILLLAPHTKAAGLNDTEDEPHTYQCLGYKTLGKMLDAADTRFEGAFYNIQGFDTDADGAIDLILMFSYVNGRFMHPIPVRYLTYVNGETVPNRQWVDVAGNGRCQDIIPVVKLLGASGYGGPLP